MVKIPFKVSARTARLIGRENVSNADGAVIELVKNSHDADANNALIVFGKDELYIIDNGHGMTDEIIRNMWMTIGTDNKELEPYTPNRRVKAGAKGIGRFALDRLGSKVEMFTLPRGKRTGYRWSIDWTKFDGKSLTVEDVQADLEEINNLNLEDKIKSVTKDLTNLANMNLGQGGTVLRIEMLRDIWTQTAIGALFQNLESLVPDMENDSFSLNLRSTLHPEMFGEVQPLINEDFDYKISANFDSSTRAVTATIERGELDVIALENKFSNVFLNPLLKQSPYTLEDFKASKFTKTHLAGDLLPGFKGDDAEFEKLGDFSFVVSFAKNSAPGGEETKKYPYRNAEYANRKEWLKHFGGIKIFRDHFRVRPYGENGNDWLMLGDRKAASPAGAGQALNAFRVGPNQVAGSVYISRLSNLAFQDKSSREGLQENETFTLFQNLLKAILSLLENDRSRIFYCLSELYKETNLHEQTKEEGRAIVARIKDSKSGTDNKKQDKHKAADTEKLAEAFSVLEDEIEEQREEIRILRSLASAGLITTAVAHELHGLENVLAIRNQDLKELIAPYVKADDLKDIKDAFNPYIMLQEMEQTDKNLQEWLNYALMPLRRDRRKRKRIFLDEYFGHLEDTWKNLLLERKVKLNLKGLDASYQIKMFPIDLDTIFSNLIINSVESFSRQKKVGSVRDITIACSKKGQLFVIDYLDNGAGLDQAFKDNPDEIFLPQVTTKRDGAGNEVGTGMGMYLVKSVVEDNGGSVKITNVKDGFCLSISMQGAE